MLHYRPTHKKSIQNPILKIRLAKRTAVQAGRSRGSIPMGSLGFFINIILSAALWPWD
jgi:hypothetical protein